MLEACDIGHRVVVRHRVGQTEAGRPLLTDLLGTLVTLDGERLVVRTDAGAERVVPLAEVTAAKRVPPRPARWSEIIELERIADRAWPAPVHERLGEWLLRAAQGWTNRANSALPLGDPGVSLDEAVVACVAWYRGHGLTPRITVPLPVRRDVAGHLAAHGWYGQPPVLVQTAPITGLDIADVTDPTVRVELADRPSARFLNRLASWKNSLPDAANHVLTGVEPVVFVEALVGDELLATARGALVEGWLHVGSVQVDPAARRRGLGRAVTAALTEWAAPQGARRAVLQVEEANAAAVALYAGLGFTTHHRYVTYVSYGA